jgi:hypothetical protein
MPRKSRAGGAPPQGPTPSKVFEGARPNLARPTGLSLEELRRLEKLGRRHQALMDASLPPELQRRFEALEREHRAKVAAEAEAAAQEVAKQARRAQRKGVGGRPRELASQEADAAQIELREHPEIHHEKRDAIIEYLRNWFKGRGKAVSRGVLQREVLWPVLGRKARR